tara:strand:- start:1530 stop:1688 length:159 start_codon:yes stop_codon:yes gene_type:complete
LAPRQFGQNGSSERDVGQQEESQWSSVQLPHVDGPADGPEMALESEWVLEPE